MSVGFHPVQKVLKGLLDGVNMEFGRMLICYNAMECALSGGFKQTHLLCQGMHYRHHCTFHISEMLKFSVVASKRLMKISSCNILGGPGGARVYSESSRRIRKKPYASL